MSSSLANSLNSFSGENEENVKYFLEQIKAIANLEQWNEEKKILILKLNCKGKALKFLMDDPLASVEKNYLNLEKLLIEKFQKKESFQQIQNKFSSIIQHPSQTIKDLAEMVSQVAEQYVDDADSNNPAVKKLKENMKLTKFLEALRQDIRVEVKKLGPTTFESAVKIAKNVENAFQEQDTCFTNNIRSTQSIEMQTLLNQQLENNKAILRLTEQLNDLKNKNNNNERSQPSTSNTQKVICQICSKNHSTQQCWYFPKQFGHNNWRGNTGRGNFPDSRRGFHPYRSRRYNNNRRNLN